jgi:hypothetical protein
MGIEPTPSAWKAEVLPLNYTRFALGLMTHFRFVINFTTLRLNCRLSGSNLISRQPPLVPQQLLMVEGVGFEPT